MIGSHAFGQGYFGQGPLTLLDLVRKRVLAVGVYIGKSVAAGIHRVFTAAVGGN